jgi:N-acetylglutamate synthase/N-acetylornithine aminotransferase
MRWPAGFKSSAVASGIKEEGLDLGTLVASGPVEWAGTFTTNASARSS